MIPGKVDFSLLRDASRAQLIELLQDVQGTKVI